MTVDLNRVADAAIADLQKSIDALTASSGHPGVDEDALDRAVEALEAKQAEISDLTLAAIEESPENAAAIAALNAAAERLSRTAQEMGKVARALDKATGVVDSATSLIGAIGGLVPKG